MRAKSCLTRKTRYKKEQEISLLLFSVHTPLSQRRRWVPVSAPRIIGYKGGCDTCHFCGLSHFQWYTILGAFPVPISQVRPAYSPTAAHFIGKSGGDIAEHPRRKLKTLLRGFAPLIGQHPQLPPQEDFPFLLSRSMLRIIRTTTAANPNVMRIVARFSDNQANICVSSFHGFRRPFYFAAPPKGGAGFSI